MAEYEIGQTVTVMGSYGTYAVAVSTIERTTKRKIILANGMEFSDRGVEWGSSSSYHGRRIRPYRDGDRENIRRRNLVTRLGKVQWDELTDEQLIKVYEIVNPKS